MCDIALPGIAQESMAAIHGRTTVIRCSMVVIHRPMAAIPLLHGGNPSPFGGDPSQSRVIMTPVLT